MPLILEKNSRPQSNGRVSFIHGASKQYLILSGLAYSFENPPVAPTFDSPSIDWEESIVEGHPTHPVGEFTLSKKTNP